MDSTQNERSSVLAKYFSEIRNYPLLSKEQEQSLAGRVAGGSPAGSIASGMGPGVMHAWRMGPCSRAWEMGSGRPRHRSP